MFDTVAEDSGPNVPVTVNEIQHAISCEFFYAFENTGGSASPFRSWGAIVALSLKATDTLDVVPGLGAITAKAGNATLTMKSSALTVHNEVGDTDDISYAIGLASSANLTDARHSILR